MTMTLRLSLAALGGLLLAGTAVAQPATGGARDASRDRMWGQLDTNNDGRITRDEGMAWLQGRFQQADTDRDGAISLAEMQAVRGSHGTGPAAAPAQDGRRAEMRAALFRGLDANSDGRVTMDEVRPAVEARFRAADANNDGAVTRDELPGRGARRERGDAPAAR